MSADHELWAAQERIKILESELKSEKVRNANRILAEFIDGINSGEFYLCDFDPELISRLRQIFTPK